MHLHKIKTILVSVFDLSRDTTRGKPGNFPSKCSKKCLVFGFNRLKLLWVLTESINCLQLWQCLLPPSPDRRKAFMMKENRYGFHDFHFSTSSAPNPAQWTILEFPPLIFFSPTTSCCDSYAKYITLDFLSSGHVQETGKWRKDFFQKARIVKMFHSTGLDIFEKWFSKCRLFLPLQVKERQFCWEEHACELQQDYLVSFHYFHFFYKSFLFFPTSTGHFSGDRHFPKNFIWLWRARFLALPLKKFLGLSCRAIRIEEGNDGSLALKYRL